MKANKINKLLQGVYNDLLEHISDESIKDIFKHKSFVTGGCIPSMAMDEYVTDYDIYLFDKESVDAVKFYFQNIHYCKTINKYLPNLSKNTPDNKSFNTNKFWPIILFNFILIFYKR